MFDTMHGRVVALPVKTCSEKASRESDTLRQRCLHPAEIWALRRRANRPQPASRRLPAVARAG